MENLDQILDAPVQQEGRRFEYAGFWIRFAAYFLDTLLMWGLIFVLAIGLNDTPLMLNFLSLVGGVLYFSLMESSESQATLGKMAVGIKVGDLNGNRISFGNAIGRYFGKILSGLILGIGFMMAGWDDRKQALHDKLADTYVFYK